MSEIDHASRDHAIFSPSGMKYIEACPSFEQNQIEHEMAAIGTACHEAVEARDPGKAPEGCEDLVVKALRLLEHLEKDEYPNIKFQIEQRVWTHEIDCWGTVDLLGYDEEKKHIVLLDWKFGHLYVDEAEKNIQLGTYAIGAWQKYPEAQTCDVWLANPRRDEVSHHTYNLAGKADLESRITKAIQRRKAERGKTFEPGNHCEYCKLAADGSCPKLQGSLIKPFASAQLRLPDEMDPALMTSDQISEALDAEKLLTKMVEGWAYKLKQEALSRLDKGEVVPSYVRKTKRGRITVKDPHAVVNVAKEFGVTPETLETCIKVDVSSIGEVIYENSPNKQKKKTKDSFMKMLTTEDYISQPFITYLKKEKAPTSKQTIDLPE